MRECEGQSRMIEVQEGNSITVEIDSGASVNGAFFILSYLIKENMPTYRICIFTALPQSGVQV
ncbi:MAG: hypothetical protein NVSMB33_14980 [Ktedonobacteraceae bacterium]